MMPERKRDHLRKAGVARAKMHIKMHLAWLDGFPAAQQAGRIDWALRPRLGHPAPQGVTVDRERIRQSQQIITQLVHRFPHAMPQVVGDVAAWHARVHAVLELLKQAIHHGRDVTNMTAAPWELLTRAERQQVDTLLQAHPRLHETVRAVVWAGAVWQEPREYLLGWIGAHAPALERHLASVGDEPGRANLLLLGDIVYHDGAAEMVFAREILCDPRSFTVATDGFEEAARQFLAGLDAWQGHMSLPPAQPRQPDPTFGPRCVRFLQWLAVQRPAVRRPARQIAGMVLSHHLLDAWQAAWETLIAGAQATIRRLHEVVHRITRVEFHRQAEQLTAEIESALATPPLPLPLREILQDVQTISQQPSRRLHQAFCRLLEAVPVENDTPLESHEWGWRDVTLREVAGELAEGGPQQKLLHYLEHATRFLASQNDPAIRLRPWEGVTSEDRGNMWTAPWRVVAQELTDPRQVGPFFAALARLVDHPQYDYNRNDEVAWLVAAAPSVDVACQWFADLADKDLLDNIYQDRIAAAAALASDDVSFVELCNLLCSTVWSGYDRLMDSLVALHDTFQQAGWPTLIPALLRGDRGGNLARCARESATLRSSGLACTPRPFASGVALPEWALALPPELHPVITSLCAVFPDSRAQIERLLAGRIPRVDRLKAEIETLTCLVRERPDDQRLARRLANLRERLDHPRPLTKHVLDRLQSKIEESLTNRVFNEYRQAVESALQTLVAGGTTSRQVADQLANPRHQELVCAILAEREPFRSFGLRLLRKRFGNEPWDLDTEPANRRFVATMTARGIRMTPWQAAGPLRVVAGPRGRPVALAFERDEVEQLLMGHYFQTCLSPHGANFFSAIANAVDVNKQVLYARDYARGNVVGRCLFAIGETGGVVTFYPYCHDEAFPLAGHVTEIAKDLAARMNTFVAHTDRVPCLVAPDWYDDGANDLGQALASADSPVRQAIATAAAETLLASLEAALAPQGLTDIALALLTELPEWNSRPQMIVPLLTLFERWRARLPARSLVTAAIHAHRAGERAWAAGIARRFAPDCIARETRKSGYISPWASAALTVLADEHPSTALRVLRQTRPRGVRRDEQEWNDGRLRLLVLCLDRLSRPKGAEALRNRMRK